MRPQLQQCACLPQLSRCLLEPPAALPSCAGPLGEACRHLLKAQQALVVQGTLQSPQQHMALCKRVHNAVLVVLTADNDSLQVSRRC